MELPQKLSKKLKIIDVSGFNESYFSLKLFVGDPFPKFNPGQFVEVLSPESSAFLRRPISVHDVDENEKTLTLLIKIIGKGTKALSQLSVGNYVDVVFPLGNGFSISEDYKKVLLVGGGCGMAPLLFLARTLKKYNLEVDIIIGGKTAADIPNIEAYSNIASTHIMTENGEKGGKGLVTQNILLSENIKSFDCIYTCGPEPMMKAVAKLAESAGVPCQVSLENMMACGIGVCLCCAVNIDGENKRTCVEGPVFNSMRIQSWKANEK